MRFLLTLFIIWVLWRVLRSVIDDLQRRMEDQQREADKRTASASRRRSAPRPVQRQPARPPEGRFDTERHVEGGTSQGETDLERWYREALERKRRLSGAERPYAEPTRVEPVEVERPSEIRIERREHIARAEPRVRRRDERAAKPVTVSKKEKRAPEPPKAQPYAYPTATKPRKFREMPEPGISQKPALADFLAGGTWELDDVRRGIVFAEILGPPKAFGDIDAHVI